MKRFKKAAGIAAGVFVSETLYEWFYGKYFVSPVMDWETCDNLWIGLQVLRILLLIALITVAVLLHKEKKSWIYTTIGVAVALCLMIHGFGENEKSGILQGFQAYATETEIITETQQAYPELDWFTVHLREGGSFMGVDWTEGNITLNRKLSCIMFMTHENRHGAMTYFMFFGKPSEKSPDESWDDFEECRYAPLFGG